MIIVANEGAKGSPSLKMYQNPGGDWHPGFVDPGKSTMCSIHRSRRT